MTHAVAVNRHNGALGSSRPSDVVISADGSRIYTSGADGAVRVYHGDTGELLATWQVGTALAGIDLSPDGLFLIVLEAEPLSTTPGSGDQEDQYIVAAYKVDTGSGAVTTFLHEAYGNDWAFHDVAILADGTAFLTQKTLPGISRSPVPEILDLATGTFTAALDGLRDASILSDSPLGLNVLIGEADISDAPLRIYTPGAGFTAHHHTYQDNVSGFNTGAQAMSSTGIVAQHLNDWGLHIYSSAFVYERNLRNLYPGFIDNIAGLAFDSAGEFLFVLDTDSDAIIQLRTSDWSIVTSFPVGADLTGFDGDFGNRLLIGPDLRYFTVVTNSGLLQIDNPNVSATRTGTEGADVLVGTGLHDVLEGLGGNDSLTGGNGSDLVEGGAGHDVLRMHDGGDDTANGGAGNDNIFFIGALTGADVVNGGEGTDTLILQGAYGSLTLTAKVTQIENISILGGNNVNFGEPGTNRYDYVLTVHDANFAAGVQARINGAALLAGEDFTFDGSAETDALFVVYGGKGKDTLTGGLGNDIFFYAEERFANGDTVNGGSGYDGMFLRGNYTIDFNAPGYTGLFTSIENLTLTSATDERYARGGGTEFDYNLTLSDAIVGAGQQLTVSGALLLATETMIFDASAETDGTLRLFGGKASDTLKGGALADLIHGNLGADTLAGGGGADAFRYQNIAESNSGSMDQILDFTSGTDKIELDRIDANANVAGNQAFSWIGSNAFTGSAGQLRGYEQGGSWFVEGDVNGDGAADLVIALTLQGAAPLGAGDFLL